MRGFSLGTGNGKKDSHVRLLFLIFFLLGSQFPLSFLSLSLLFPLCPLLVPAFLVGSSRGFGTFCSFPGSLLLRCLFNFLFFSPTPLFFSCCLSFGFLFSLEFRFTFLAGCVVRSRWIPQLTANLIPAWVLDK